MNCSPNIVASQSWVNQTSNLGDINTPTIIGVFTASSQGLYRVNIGMLISGPGSPSVEVRPFVNTTNAGNFNTTIGIPPSNQMASFCSALNSGDHIGIVTDIGVAGSSGWFYDLYVTIEQLQ